MILNKLQYDAVFALANVFVEKGLVSVRCGVAVGITAFFTSFPQGIRLTRTGYTEETYAHLGEFETAYIGVV
jgi:hypothetical protein